MKAMKKPIPLRFRFAKEVQDVATLEGVVTARAGDAVLTGTRGECWPVAREKFETSYDFDETTGVCSKKPVVVQVEQMNAAFEVSVSWSGQPLRGNAGDYKVAYGPGDFGVVARDIFDETYVVL